LLVTSTLMVQLTAAAPEAPMPALDTAMTLLPGTVVTLAAPPTQVDETLGVLATTRPDGRLSLKLMPLTATLFAGLVIVNVKVVLEPLAMVEAANDLVSTGVMGGLTLMHGLTGEPMVALVAVTVLLSKSPFVDGQVALLAPATLVNELTVSVHAAVPAVMPMPLIVSVPPAVVVAVPTPGPVQPGLIVIVGEALLHCNNAPNTSVMSMFDCAGLPLLLVKVNTADARPPDVIVVGVNAFVNTGGAMTFKHWSVTSFLRFVNGLMLLLLLSKQSEATLPRTPIDITHVTPGAIRHVPETYDV
jgi:hypothetical protein